MSEYCNCYYLVKEIISEITRWECRTVMQAQNSLSEYLNLCNNLLRFWKKTQIVEGYLLRRTVPSLNQLEACFLGRDFL